ncbi:MAG: hypothetical protein R3F49_17645 [Planctomycetota bacterium]
MNLGGNFGKNLVIAGALLAAGFFAAWLRFRPYLGNEGSFTDGVETFEAAGLDRVRYAIWEAPEPLAGEVNSPENERKPVITPDGRHLVFVVGERGLGVDLWIADLVDGRALSPRPLSAVNSPSDDLAPAFAGDRLWFASNRPGSVGGLDLWTASYDRGAFGPPERVAGDINSAADDSDPAPVPGTDVIVFASNRGKLGAYPDFDLYAANPVRLADSAAPAAFDVAPLTPLNSAFEEREPTFTADGRAVVFASDREGGAGGFDLYRSGLLPGATIDGMGQGFVAPEALIGVNGATDERGPFLSLDGFTLYFGIEAEVAGKPAADLFRASSKELFRTPGPPVGWRELLLLALLLMLALLAALAKRWRGLDILYKCVLISLLVHLLMLWWAREVYPEPVMPAQEGDGSRTRIRLVVDPSSLSAQRNLERAGELSAQRAERAAESTPDRAEQQAVEVEREVAAAALQLERSERAEAADAPARAAVTDVARASTPARTEAVAAARESFERLAEAAPSAVEVAAQDVRTDRTERPTQANAAASPEALRSAESAPDSAMALAPSTAARVERSRRADSADASPAVPMRREAFVDRGPRAAQRDIEVATPTERIERATDPGAGAAASAGAAFELVASDIAVQRTRGAAGAPAPGSAPERAATPGLAFTEGSAGPSGAQGVALAPASLAPFERSSRGADVGAAPAPGFRAAELGAPTRPAPSTALAGVELVTPTTGAELAQPAASGAPAFDPLAEWVPSATGLTRSAAGAARTAPERGPARVATALSPSDSGANDPLSRAPSPVNQTFEVGTRVAADTPVAAPQRNEWDHTPYQTRSGAQKAEALDVHGGSVETERAVTRGLAYLASVQRREGNWGRMERDDKYGHPTIGKTGLALLSFLGAGHTQKSDTEYSPVVARGVQYLLSAQDPASGHFGDSDAYSHAVATYALAECFALTKDERLRGPLRDAVQHIVDVQHSSGDVTEDGGWGYYYPTNRVYDRWPRASVTAWQVMALESAQLGGLPVPKQVFRRAASFLANSWDPQRGAFRYSQDPQRLRSSYPTLPGSTPASIFALSLLGADVTSADYRAARRFVTERLPQGYRFTGEDDFVHKAQANLYFWYYGTLAMFRVGGDDWKRWNTAMKETLLPAQDADGSWKPISIYAEYAQDTDRDRVYTTALCVLTLEVYYRYFTPLLKVD